MKISIINYFKLFPEIIESSQTGDDRNAKATVFEDHWNRNNLEYSIVRTPIQRPP